MNWNQVLQKQTNYQSLQQKKNPGKSFFSKIENLFLCHSDFFFLKKKKTKRKEKPF